MIRAAGKRRFFKMSGSGNDFVFVDNMRGSVDWLSSARDIQEVCDRRTGVGADGVVLLEQPRVQENAGHAFHMSYYNNDGTRAQFCGNAALCSTRLATELGLASAGGDFTFESDYGPIRARIHADGQPEVDLPPVLRVEEDLALPRERGELRAGFAVVGVPHAVVMCEDADSIDMDMRGPILRHYEATRGGANVDFISRMPDVAGIRMRTFERGVEDETLACGSGAVASALLARLWDNNGIWPRNTSELTVHTSSGLPLIVRATFDPDSMSIQTSLRGEGRVVFEGELRS